ncbi:MAG: hypothetical protein ACOY7T_12335 [Pseudomonadota bacterium]
MAPPLPQALVSAEFTEAKLLAEQFARLAPGASLVFCRGPQSWARFPDAAARMVQQWIDQGRATVACGRDVRDPGRWLHRVYRKADPDPVPDGLTVRGTLAFEASAEGQVWALLRDCAAEGLPCPSNEVIANALNLETARDGGRLFERLVQQGRVRVIEPNRFVHRVIEVIVPGGAPLRTAPSKGFGK